MPCRDEHPTRENRNWRRSQIQLRIREMIQLWPSYIQQVQRNRFLQICARNRQRVNRWKDRQCETLRKRLAEIGASFVAGHHLAAVQEWDTAVAGQFWKLDWIFRGKYRAKLPPRSTWPPEVPYMNVPAFRLYMREVNRRRAEQIAMQQAQRQKELQERLEQERMNAAEVVELAARMEWRALMRKVYYVQKLLRHLQILDATYSDTNSTIPAARITRNSLIIQAGQARTLFRRLTAMQPPRPTHWTGDDIWRWNEVQKQQDLARRYAQLSHLCARSRIDPFSVRVSEWVNVIEGTNAGTVYPGARMRIAFSKHMQEALERNPNISLAEMVESWDVTVAERGEEWTYW
ncbi:hypothetical protein J1614_006665 [Plenodomus biglobosus]|nr:hypothetical protein J1614_006665 [Plenodomus biglobosus]